MKKKPLVPVLVLLAIFLPRTASANSSWVWLTGTTPLMVLPFAVVATLIIEISAVIFICKVKKRFKAALVVTLGNIISYLVPYFFSTIDWDGVGYTFGEIIDSNPIYIISAGYLLLTLAIEIPIVYYFLRDDVDSERKLVITLISANTITTAIVAVCEAIFCQGSW